MWIRLFNRVLYAPESTTEGALAAMNTALEEAASPPSSSSNDNGGGGDGDGAGAGGEGEGGEGGAAGSGDGGAAAGGAAAADGAEGEQAGGDGAQGGEGGEGGGQGAAAAEGPKPGEAGSKHRADGTFKSKDELERDKAAIAAAETAAAAGDGKGKPPAKPAKGKPDHVNDPIPDDVQGRTRQRIEGLVATTKDLTTKLTAAETELTQARELVGMIDATGADPETFARHMDVLALMHSSDVGDKQAVVKYLRAAADKIGKELGETPPGANALEGHQDLIDEVEAGELTQARAEEIAKGRNREKALETHRTTTQQQNDANAAANAQRAAVKTALNGLTAELRKKDGDAKYERKHKLLVPFIRRLNPAMKPEAMVQAVREAYDALVLPDVPKPNGGGQQNGRAPAGTGGQQPMRHKQGAGGGQVRQPGSALEAMNAALEEMPR